MKMAAGSERSPPPFPDSEEQDPEPELGEDEDSDDGADIFTGGVSNLTTSRALALMSGSSRTRPGSSLSR